MLRIRRAHVENSLKKAGISRASEHARAMYASLGTAIFEFLWLARRRSPPPGTVEFTPAARDALARFGRNRRDGAPARGLVVATAHTGNWDFVACALAAEHVDLTVVTKRLSAPSLDAFWQKERAAFGVELIDGDGTFSCAARAVERGRAAALMVDQVPERRSAVIRAPFLGQMARCDTTAALLAARTGVPLVLAIGRRLPDGRHSVDVPMELVPPPRASRDWVLFATRRINAELERFVRQYPDQWLWMHRRWKTAADLGLEVATGAPSDGQLPEIDAGLLRSRG